MTAAFWSLIGLVGATLFGNLYWLSSRMDAGFARMDSRFDTINARLDAINARLDTHLTNHN